MVWLSNPNGTTSMGSWRVSGVTALKFWGGGAEKWGQGGGGFSKLAQVEHWIQHKENTVIVVSYIIIVVLQ